MVRFTYKQRVVHTSWEGIVCGGNPASSSPSDAPSYNSQHFAQISQDNSDLWRPDWYLGMRAEVSISVCVSGRRDSVGVLWETSDWGRWRHLAVISVSVSHWQSGGTGLARLLCHTAHCPTSPYLSLSLSLSLFLSQIQVVRNRGRNLLKCKKQMWKSNQIFETKITPTQIA